MSVKVIFSRTLSSDIHGKKILESNEKVYWDELAVAGSGTAVVNAEKFTVKDASLNLSWLSSRQRCESRRRS